jgi:hypothetical protein
VLPGVLRSDRRRAAAKRLVTKIERHIEFPRRPECQKPLAARNLSVSRRPTAKGRNIMRGRSHCKKHRKAAPAVRVCERASP